MIVNCHKYHWDITQKAFMTIRGLLLFPRNGPQIIINAYLRAIYGHLCLKLKPFYRVESS